LAFATADGFEAVGYRLGGQISGMDVKPPLPLREQWNDALSVFWSVQLSRGSDADRTTGSTRLRLRCCNIIILLLICQAINMG